MRHWLQENCPPKQKRKKRNQHWTICRGAWRHSRVRKAIPLERLNYFQCWTLVGSHRRFTNDKSNRRQAKNHSVLSGAYVSYYPECKILSSNSIASSTEQEREAGMFFVLDQRDLGACQTSIIILDRERCALQTSECFADMPLLQWALFAWRQREQSWNIFIKIHIVP